MKRRSNHRPGFALIGVVMLTAALAIGGAILLDVVRVDLIFGKTGRQTEEARQIAEGALMEVINDQDTRRARHGRCKPNSERRQIAY